MSDKDPKQCSSCPQPKTRGDFHNRKKSKDGKQGKCKECVNTHSSQYRKANRDKLHAKRDYSAKKYKAQQLVRNEVRAGRLIKTDCEECDSKELAVGHHDDYDKPLDVRWLCPCCHGAWHFENGEAANA